MRACADKAGAHPFGGSVLRDSVPSVEGMTNVSRTFDVRPQPAVVIDYLKDFGNAEEWDPGTESCRRQDTGPVQVGSTWHNVSKIAGVSTELDYRLESLSAETIVFKGHNESATSTDTITVVPSPEGFGSRVTYEAHIEMKGLAKLADPVMKVVFEKVGSDTEDDMVTVLNRLDG
jgi:carbon monoxide dehydrogenase subunit G